MDMNIYSVIDSQDELSSLIVCDSREQCLNEDIGLDQYYEDRFDIGD
jgi:hypothetical protein